MKILIAFIWSLIHYSKNLRTFAELKMTLGESYNYNHVGWQSTPTAMWTETNELVTSSPNVATNDLRCDQLKGLSSGQTKHCLLNQDHLGVVAKGINSSLSECKWQFRNHRWNCNTHPQLESFLGPLFKIGSREAAFTHALVSAGVVYDISRSCKEGQLMTCGCSNTNRPENLRKDWLWGGCGDNVDYGYRFSQEFLDLKEKEKTHRKGSRQQGRSLINLHNNEAGRRAVTKNLRVTCKCHGVSGSCSLITCWHQLPTFREIGDYMRSKYETATAVKVNKKGRLQIRDPRSAIPTVTDLVFLEDSPNYCSNNITVGTLGTQGRTCNKTSRGMDGCNSLCCGRGYDTRKIGQKDRCNCKFHWCCYVKCDVCSKMTEINTCK